MNKYTLKQILGLFALGFIVYITIRYFWPLLLVIAVLIAIGYFRLKKQVSDAEEDMRQNLYNENTGNQIYEDAHAEPRRPEPEGEIIDAEFTVKNREEMKMHG